MVEEEKRNSKEKPIKAPGDGEFHVEDMTLYLYAYNLFVAQVMNLEWPEGHALPDDSQTIRMVFQMYWKQRHRQRLEEERMQKKRSRQSPDESEITEFRIGGEENVSLTRHTQRKMQKSVKTVFKKSGSKFYSRIPVP